MRSYTSLLVLFYTLSLVSANEYDIGFNSYDSIVKDLGPQLSPGASIILPQDNVTRFAELTTRFSNLAQPDITAIVRVGTETDVPEIIKYAKRNDRAILAGSARHGWPTSLSNVKNAIMIDITTLSTIDVDLGTSTMTVGGGVTSGEVMSTLQAAGKEASTGVCPCVGFLGATLGGGHGRMQGLHGLISDNLLFVHLATADGELITVSKTSYPDLYWGLRGAGHNFGIVTKAVYKVYDQTSEGLQFSADITYDPEHIEAIFTALNEFEQQPETSIFVLFSVQQSLKPFVAIVFVSSTPTIEARSQLDSALGHIPHLTRTESVFPWSKLEDLDGVGIGRVTCTITGRIDPRAASLKHFDIPTMRSLYSRFIEFVTQNPTANGSVVLSEIYPIQGVQAFDDAETAYPLRQERFNVILSAYYPDPSLDDISNTYLKGSVAELHATGGFEKPVVYLNYAHRDEGFGAMYGYAEWRREKLTGLKRKYDPDGTFNGYNPIPFY